MPGPAFISAMKRNPSFYEKAWRNPFMMGKQGGKGSVLSRALPASVLYALLYLGFQKGPLCSETVPAPDMCRGWNTCGDGKFARRANLARAHRLASGGVHEGDACPLRDNDRGNIHKISVSSCPARQNVL